MFRPVQTKQRPTITLALSLLTLATLAAPGRSLPNARSAHQLYDALNAQRLDPAAAYQIKPEDHLELRRADAKLSFDNGELIFFAPLNGQINGVAFAGRGHILCLPRDAIEKQQLARFLGAPILDQDFSSAYIRFSDTTAQDLLRQLKSANIRAEADNTSATRWDPVLIRNGPAQSLRLLLDTLLAAPQPYFYALLDGFVSGPFDVLIDPLRLEPFVLGQGSRSAASSNYDVWASYKLPDTITPPPDFHASHYALQTAILPDHSLDATADITIRAEGAGDRAVVFSLSRALEIESITGPAGQPLEYFQNEGLTRHQRSIQGNDYLLVVLPSAVPRNTEFPVHFHYRGNIIDDAGNDVLFVGARESWYPHLGDSADFAGYDLTMRWPRRLRLIATGTKLDEREDGDTRVGHWKTEKPVAIAGFNLGEYASTTINAQNYSIDVYANHQLEQKLAQRLEPSEPPLPSFGGRFGSPKPSLMSRDSSTSAPSPTAALKHLAQEIDASIRFYESYGGPFPFHNLSVSQIPGTFGQGWPGLLYISTLSFLPDDAQRHAGLSESSRAHFTELVPFHEVAHQWWGNVVGWSSYRDQWIDEAMANYLTLLFAETRKNPNHTLHLWLERYRALLVEQAPSADQPTDQVGALELGSRLDSSKSPNAYEDLIYSKGSWVIHMLREMLRQPGPNPDARFHALLKTLVTKYAYRALSTEDLRHEVEAVMTPGMDLEGEHSMAWFFDQWVAGTGIPHYQVEFTTHKSETGYVVRGKLLQTEVPNSFIARVPIYAATTGAHSILLGTVVASGPETSFHFNTATPPHKLVIDPQFTLLCTTE